MPKAPTTHLKHGRCRRLGRVYQHSNRSKPPCRCKSPPLRARVRAATRASPNVNDTATMNSTQGYQTQEHEAVGQDTTLHLWYWSLLPTLATVASLAYYPYRYSGNTKPHVFLFPEGRLHVVSLVRFLALHPNLNPFLAPCYWHLAMPLTARFCSADSDALRAHWVVFGCLYIDTMEYFRHAAEHRIPQWYRRFGRGAALQLQPFATHVHFQCPRVLLTWYGMHGMVWMIWDYGRYL